MGYAKEFSFEQYVVPAYLQTYEWSDVSWHNDVCPRFENKELMLAVWVDCTDPNDREYEDWKQYTVVKMIPLNCEETTLADGVEFETENMSNLEIWLTLYKARLSITEAQNIINNSPFIQEAISDELATILALITEQMESLD